MSTFGYFTLINHKIQKHLIIERISWKLSKIDVQPQFKSTESEKFVDGKFIKSTTYKADIAVATLKNDINLSDEIFPICLPEDVKSELFDDVWGVYSGWDANKGQRADFKLPLAKIDDGEFYRIKSQRDIGFVEGWKMF